MFSYVFDSDDSVVDIVADETLSHISTKRDDYGEAVADPGGGPGARPPPFGDT